MVCCLLFFVSCLLLVVVCCVFGVHDDEGDVDDDDWLCSLSGFDVQCILDSRKVQHVSKDIGKILMSRMHFRSIMGKLPISNKYSCAGRPYTKSKTWQVPDFFFPAVHGLLALFQKMQIFVVFGQHARKQYRRSYIAVFHPVHFLQYCDHQN